MSAPFKFPRVGSSALTAPKGLLSRLKWLVDRHSQLAENIEGEDGIEVRRNYRGGVTIGTSNGWGVSAFAYSSYFRVIDASTETECKIGVSSGGTTLGAGRCGVVKINGDPVDVAGFTSDEIESDGTYWIWLQSWIDAEDGPHAKIVVGDDTPPEDGEGSVAYANQLLGRVVVVEGDIASINQDYLRGGDHMEILFANCQEENPS